MNKDFFAMVSRMRHINRWSLMRNTITENIEEHSHQVAVIAHAIAVIRKVHFSIDSEGVKRTEVDPDRVVTLALFHDVSEILTGDMPTPVKYYNSEIEGAYRDVEKRASRKLLGMIPGDLSDFYSGILMPDKSDPVVSEALKIVKSADKISALIKCIEEGKAGNREFVHAGRKISDSIFNSDMPEVKYFLEYFLPSYHKTLDEISLD